MATTLEQQKATTPESAIERLKNGNAQFVKISIQKEI